MELSCFSFPLHGISFSFFPLLFIFLYSPAVEFVMKSVSFAMDYKLLSPQFFLLFVFIARFMNFSSLKEEENHSFRPTPHSYETRETSWALFLWGWKWRFTMIASLYDAFSPRKFECENVCPLFFYSENFPRVSFIEFWWKKFSEDKFSRPFSTGEMSFYFGVVEVKWK